MFSLLNRNAERGKFRARRCKMLNSWSQISAVFGGVFRGRAILLQARGLEACIPAALGIQLSACPPTGPDSNWQQKGLTKRHGNRYYQAESSA